MEKLSAKHPFIYDTGELLIAISGKDCIILNDNDINRIEKHKRIFNESNDVEDLRIAFQKLKTYASGLIGIMSKPNDLEETISKLDPSQINALENEILNFELKYRMFN